MRIEPELSGSGAYWRCAIAPSSAFDPQANMQITHGFPSARYTSGSASKYFGWGDAQRLGPKRLAELFVQRFPELAKAARGSDWSYVGWYADMLHQTEPCALPIFHADFVLSRTTLPFLAFDGIKREIPLPPPLSVQAPAPISAPNQAEELSRLATTDNAPPTGTGRELTDPPMMQLQLHDGKWVVNPGAYMSSEDRVFASELVDDYRRTKILYAGRLVEGFTDEEDGRAATVAWISWADM